MLSPRQKAIAAGEDWYMSETPHPNVGQIGLRRVNNSECRVCSEERRNSKKDGKFDYDLHSDMIIDRWSAKDLGFTAYRTGRQCKRGHTGWRYIVNNGCIDCMKGKP
jgi:hypothetical protein